MPHHLQQLHRRDPDGPEPVRAKGDNEEEGQHRYVDRERAQLQSLPVIAHLVDERTRHERDQEQCGDEALGLSSAPHCVATDTKPKQQEESDDHCRRCRPCPSLLVKPPYAATRSGGSAVARSLEVLPGHGQSGPQVSAAAPRTFAVRPYSRCASPSRRRLSTLAVSAPASLASAGCAMCAGSLASAYCSMVVATSFASARIEQSTSRSAARTAAETARMLAYCGWLVGSTRIEPPPRRTVSGAL